MWKRKEGSHPWHILIPVSLGSSNNGTKNAERKRKEKSRILKKEKKRKKRMYFGKVPGGIKSSHEHIIPSILNFKSKLHLQYTLQTKQTLIIRSNRLSSSDQTNSQNQIKQAAIIRSNKPL